MLLLGGRALWLFGGIYSWRRPGRILLLRSFQAKKVSRPLKRWLRVGSARSYHFLQNRLARRFTMNMFWQGAFTKLVKVKCSDTWWKQCVDLLMYSCHLIVVDLSWVKVGTEWELDKIDRRDVARMISESHVWQGVQEESNQPVLSSN